MKTFFEALKKGFEPVGDLQSFIKNTEIQAAIPNATISPVEYWTFKFGDNDEYELNFEPLLFENQYYVALYKNQELLTEKVVIKPGFIKKDE